MMNLDGRTRSAVPCTTSPKFIWRVEWAAHISRQRWATLAIMLLVACSRADSQRTDGSAETDSAHRALRGPMLSEGGPYRVVRLTELGRVTGTVSFDGPAPVDSVIHVTSDTDLCGETLVDISVVRHGQQLADVVVWIDGVTAGKALPVAKRYEITSDQCRITPRVQTAMVDGTLNVSNSDEGAHLARFTRWSDGQVIGRIAETEPGAVVPVRTVLAQPGLVEVGCDLHPWSRAWIAVFGQPYFATTDRNGAFTIDSIPPGRYRISVWHERFGTRSDSVTVVAGSTATASMKFGAQAITSPSAARN